MRKLPNVFTWRHERVERYVIRPIAEHTDQLDTGGEIVLLGKRNKVADEAVSMLVAAINRAWRAKMED